MNFFEAEILKGKYFIPKSRDRLRATMVNLFILIGAFIMLAMAALIRKVLIYSLSSEKSEELLIIAAVIVGLAIAYWLVNVKKYNKSLKEG